jgi:hypothetical protein
MASGRPLVAGPGPLTHGCRAAGDHQSGLGHGRATRPRPLVADGPATRGRRLRVAGPRPAGDQRSPADRGPTLDPLQAVPIFLIFLIFGCLGNGPGLLGEWVHSAPIFSSFPLHLEV